jgi:predicted AAA+ superfamily ATPase
LDEIQAAPELLTKLRWFAEECPDLPVIAAGSLLEFVLNDHSFSMPVGRISYAYLEPLSFEEFLLARDQKGLHDYLSTYHTGTPIPLALHEHYTAFFKEYLLVGGLPAVVESWRSEQSLSRVNQLHNDLLSTYRDDFSKYKGRIARDKLDDVLMAVPKMLGQKFVLSRVNPTLNSVIIKNILDLLAQAKICHRVWSVSANGVPPGAEIREKFFKEILIDTGLCSAALGLSFSLIDSTNDLTLINQGGLSEQVVGQMLRTLPPPYIEPALYYWHREEKGSSAEIDYIIQQGHHIIPIEIKSGSTGSMKSLHLFMGLKKLPLALRINSDLPNKTAISVNDAILGEINYTLISIPFYLTGQIPRLLSEKYK